MIDISNDILMKFLYSEKIFGSCSNVLLWQDVKKVLDDKNDIRKYLRSREESGNKVGKILPFQQNISSILNQTNP